MCAAGQRDGLKSTSGRIVTLTSYMTSLVLLAGYSASLISSLAVQLRHLPFRDLQGLLYDGSYKLGVQENSSTLNIFDVRLRKLTTFIVNIVPQSALILRHWQRFQLNAMRMTQYICICVCVGMYLCMCVCIYMYVCMYMCIQVCLCLRIYVCIYVRIYVCMCVYMYVCVYVFMCVCMYVCMYVCVYRCMFVSAYICMYISMYICVCIYECKYMCMYLCM
jgi:hypothetical protein